MEPVAKSDQGAGKKWPEVKGAIVEPPLSFRISHEKHLKAAVEQKPLHFVGSDPTANSVRCLEYENGQPTFMEPQSTGEARKASPHDQDIRTRHCHLFEGHRVAQILLAIGNPATIEADIFGISRDLLYLLEFLVARQNTKVTCVVSGTDVLPHFFSFSCVRLNSFMVLLHRWKHSPRLFHILFIPSLGVFPAASHPS